jgi:hypothetical protein
LLRGSVDASHVTKDMLADELNIACQKIRETGEGMK